MGVVLVTVETPEQKALRLGVPCLGGSNPLLEKAPPLPDLNLYQTVAICGKCGLELQPIMGYVCSKDRCPSFIQAGDPSLL